MVAFYLPGGVPVYAFALIMGAAASLGLAWAAYSAPRKQVISVLDAGLCALAGGLVGGRLAYVAASWGYFQSQGPKMVEIYLGGLAWPGALAGGLLGLAIYAGIAHQRTGVLANSLLPLGGTMAMAAWLACWLDGCAYGISANAWWALPARDEWGVWGRRAPVQLLGALATLAIYWLVDRLRPRLPVPGQAALLALLLFSLEMFAVSWLRADPVPLIGTLRMEAWFALVSRRIDRHPVPVYLGESPPALDGWKSGLMKLNHRFSPNQHPPGRRSGQPGEAPGAGPGGPGCRGATCWSSPSSR